MSSFAYADHALPIGQGQTISQPYIVARMSEALLTLGIPRSVLEIGTGCSYQTAILSKLIRHVYTVERIESLTDKARERLENLRLARVGCISKASYPFVNLNTLVHDIAFMHPILIVEITDFEILR